MPMPLLSSGRVQVTKENACALVQAADRFLLDTLKLVCEREIIKHVTVSEGM